MHFTSCEPSVDFAQGVFLEPLINSDLSFELKLKQKIPVNCLLEGRNVFAVMPTHFGKSFFQALLHVTAIEHGRRFEKESIRTMWFLLVICPMIGLIEDQIKEGPVLCYKM